MSVLENIDPKQLGERLKTARSTADLTQEDVANALGIARTTLLSIEQGQRMVRPDELHKLAAAYGKSVNDLLRATAVHVDLVAKFRRNSSEIKNKAANDAIQMLNRLAAAMIEFETRLGRKVEMHHYPERHIRSGNLEVQAEDMALDLRHKLGLGLSPISDIVSLVELELGIRIFIRPLDSSISGVFAYDPVIGACMLINAKHPRERQILTIAHEIAHYLTNRSEAFVLTTAMRDNYRDEKFANLFAIAFLMPAAATRRRFQDMVSSQNHFSPRHLVLLAHAFNVSVEAMCRRLEILNLLPSGTFDSLKDRKFSIENAKSAIGISTESDSISKPPKLTLLAVEAFQTGLFSEGQICKMLVIDRVEFRGYLDSFGSSDLDEAITIQT